MGEKIKHLEMIQAVISRMASNSFSLKGWAVTLVAGVFALSNKDANEFYFLIAYIPIIVFWGLDAYYLLQERLFRALYNKIRKLNDAEIDFDMDISPVSFHKGRNTYCRCLISKTILCFYLPLALISAVIVIITYL